MKAYSFSCMPTGWKPLALRTECPQSCLCGAKLSPPKGQKKKTIKNFLRYTKFKKNLSQMCWQVPFDLNPRAQMHSNQERSCCNAFRIHASHWNLFDNQTRLLSWLQACTSWNAFNSVDRRSWLSNSWNWPKNYCDKVSRCVRRPFHDLVSLHPIGGDFRLGCHVGPLSKESSATFES